MIWIAPSEKDTDNAALEKRLRDAAEQAVPAPHVAEPVFNSAGPEVRLGYRPLAGMLPRCASPCSPLLENRTTRSFQSGSRSGMFVSSARFVSEHKRQAAAGQSSPSPLGGERAGVRGESYSGDPTRELSIHGVEKTDETGRLCRLVAVRKDLAVHGLEGEIKHGGNINSYYDDPHDATGRFDFVLADPPANASGRAGFVRANCTEHPPSFPH